MSVVTRQRKESIPSISDGNAELNEIKKTCAKHEELCRQFAECSVQLKENDAQLDILGETATFLKHRHDDVRKAIDGKPEDTELLESLQNDIEKIDRQVNIWIKELQEVNDARTVIELHYIELAAELKRSMTSVQLANLDFDLIQRKHEHKWKRFLAEMDIRRKAAAL